MTNILNYYDRVVALLASQFQSNPESGRTNFQKMLFAFCTMAQSLQTQETNLQTLRYLNTAEGVQLDGLGQILGLSRIPGQSDASYREDLLFQIFVNSSSATPEDMIYILSYLTNASKVWYREIYPASYVMATNGLEFPVAPENPSDYVKLIQSVSPAGVEFSAIIATYNTNPFSFSSDPIINQFYVSAQPNFPSIINPLQVNAGSGAAPFYVNAGQFSDPDFGGGFAEMIGTYPNYTIDITGAGQMTEAIQIQ